MSKIAAFVHEWKTNEPKERVFMVLGLVFVLVAIVGVFVPIIPQVPFAIVAAYFFSKGSKRIHHWIRENKYFGRAVKDWEDDRVVRPKLKIISTIAMIGGAGFCFWKLDKNWAIAISAAFALAIVFVLTRKSAARSG